MHMSLVVYSFFLGVLVRLGVKLLCPAFGVWLFLDGNGYLFYELCKVKTISNSIGYHPPSHIQCYKSTFVAISVSRPTIYK
jgi:hypothetical protein